MLDGKKFRVGKEEVTIFEGRYFVGDRIRLSLMDGDGLPYAILTVNLPEDPAPGCIHVKTWGENSAVAIAALESGLFRDTGRRVRTGFMEAEEWEIVG